VKHLLVLFPESCSDDRHTTNGYRECLTPINKNFVSPRSHAHVRLRLKCDGTRTETRFRLSARWTSPFKSAGASVQSTTCSRHVRSRGSNAGYTMFRGSVKGTGYPLHSPVSHSLPRLCVVCHHISTDSTVPLSNPHYFLDINLRAIKEERNGSAVTAKCEDAPTTIKQKQEISGL